ncbi:FxSxx-COOH cyclophane-containing RiPP peptide [Streptomyces sp. NPDC057702]|uniref:FxSxx-COOH cyclophane-containing RiPP peptide n=1 Tax=unclassified Streptomyces TaxID=2593676 RepID=UPI0036B475D1
MSWDSTVNENTPEHGEPPERADATPGGAAGAPGGAMATTVDPTAPLPDVLGLDLAALRTLEHPVLEEVLGDLRGRVAQPREMLWAFNSAC